MNRRIGTKRKNRARRVARRNGLLLELLLIALGLVLLRPDWFEGMTDLIAFTSNVTNSGGR